MSKKRIKPLKKELEQEIKDLSTVNKVHIDTVDQLVRTKTRLEKEVRDYECLVQRLYRALNDGVALCDFELRTSYPRLTRPEETHMGYVEEVCVEDDSSICREARVLMEIREGLAKGGI